MNVKDGLPIVLLNSYKMVEFVKQEDNDEATIGKYSSHVLVIFEDTMLFTSILKRFHKFNKCIGKHAL